MARCMVSNTRQTLIPVVPYRCNYLSRTQVATSSLPSTSIRRQGRSGQGNRSPVTSRSWERKPRSLSPSPPPPPSPALRHPRHQLLLLQSRLLPMPTPPGFNSRDSKPAVTSFELTHFFSMSNTWPSPLRPGHSSLTSFSYHGTATILRKLSICGLIWCFASGIARHFYYLLFIIIIFWVQSVFNLFSFL